MPSTGTKAIVCRIAATLLIILTTTQAFTPASARPISPQDELYADRPISAVRFRGLQRTSEQEVRNNVRTEAGDPFDPDLVRADEARLNRLNRFRFIDVLVELQDDGSVEVIFDVEEQAMIREVQVTGNAIVTDQELLRLTGITRDLPRDDFKIERAKREIEAFYRERGHYLTTVEVDESELAETGVLIFSVLEGPRVRVRAIEFDGNTTFNDKQLMQEVKTRRAIFILQRGAIDEEKLSEDVAAIDRFYKDRGFLDVRVDRAVALSPDTREAKVTFIIDEGRQYSLGNVVAQPVPGSGNDALQVFSSKQLAGLLELQTGDVYSRDKLRKSLTIVEDSYGVLGYLDVEVRPYEIRRNEEPVVDLLLEINEGKPYRVGLIRVIGNFLTRQKVILREVRIRTGRPFDSTQIERSRVNLEQTRLFNQVKIVVQEPYQFDASFRDVIIEVKERKTSSVNFGVAVGSDSGVFGEISILQNNFDIADTPESLEEFIGGRAFRGAGQRFNMVLRPGNEIFQYLVSLTEPHLFDSEYSLTVTGGFRDRLFRRYDESRLNGEVGIGRRLGDIWQMQLSARGESIELNNIDDFAPTEVFMDADQTFLTGVRLAMTRSTITTISRPDRGSRLELSYERTGAFGGDLAYNRIEGEYSVFLAIDEDFLGRKSTLRLNTRVGYLFGGDRPPVYEQFYLGGRTFRGFEFRSVSPKGIRNNDGLPSLDPVGGEWQFFVGGQYEFPVFQETLTGVVFMDSGTVSDDVGFSDYRVSIGTGIRLYVPQLGPVPIAFDFAFPIMKEEDDEQQVFSFTAELPF
jgi:outer membrane protein insertion porin family